MRPSTFSIVACDLEAREWGVAVQSKFLAVGPVVPWAEAETGAIATQSHANTSYGPNGLAMLRSGMSAPDVLRKLTADDVGREGRQVGIVDSQGNAAAFTGKECFAWAGHHVGSGFACQGNILAGEAVVSQMANAFESTQEALAERLLAALQAGQRAGGDRRGQQSASLHVVKARGGYGGFTDRLIDLRVDDHPQPITELARIYKLHQLYFGPARRIVELERHQIAQIQRALNILGYYTGDSTGEMDAITLKALQNFHNVENLEMRWIDRPGCIDAAVLDFLLQKHSTASK